MPNHSVLIDWPWTWGFLVVSRHEICEVIFVARPDIDWEIRILAVF